MFLLHTLLNRVNNLEKGAELDYQWVEFGDVRYHVQVYATASFGWMLLCREGPQQYFSLSVSLPVPSRETIFYGGLPVGALEAIKAAYSGSVQILDLPRDGFNLTLKLNLSKLPAQDEQRQALLVKMASVRDVVLGAPLAVVLGSLSSKTVSPKLNQLVPIVHRPNESFFSCFLNYIFDVHMQLYICLNHSSLFCELIEAKRATGLQIAPLCCWSLSPLPEFKEVSAEDLSANAGFVTFVIYPRHVEGHRLEKTIWSLSTFHKYASYHVKALRPCQSKS
ncbi:hypothetical protein QQ045_026926 [Rhodiola kirilowii]